LNGESEFQWNSISEVTDPQGRRWYEMEIERGFSLKELSAEEFPAPWTKAGARLRMQKRIAAHPSLNKSLSVDFYIAQVTRT